MKYMILFCIPSSTGTDIYLQVLPVFWFHFFGWNFTSSTDTENSGRSYNLTWSFIPVYH